ncbi:sodium:calcium antiporter [Roseovarius sp.]|uniref:sodium:calcium antiporter n=1 Tax=Roseovarius sp. TaxID=1486281 RepID=UPI0026368BF1|nr:sodium:calcium antiporter [Roseovarius sp.]MDM8166819.1 sodium:calcium antiporter [Roseovarius sp.]
MFESFSLPLVFGAFALAALVVLVLGTKMAGLADRIADSTGLGEAVTGGLLLGAATSLSGTVVSLTAALDGRAGLAFSNGIGGIAAQTAFLALADMVYRKANLEHSAADVTNVFQAALLSLMLVVPLGAAMTPDVSFWAVHPASVLLLVIYLMGAYRTADMKENPMWKAVDTKETRHDTPDEETTAKESPARQIALFVAMMLVLGVAGWVIAQSAEQITDRMNLSAALVGALMTAVVTSLPELVTTLAAVRRGALQLAVGGIIGGNSFDVLFLTLSDFGYRDGSLYHAIGSGDLFWLIVGQAMTAILLLGLIVREKQGPGGIGWESVLMLSIYGGAVGFQAWSG